MSIFNAFATVRILLIFLAIFLSLNINSQNLPAGFSNILVAKGLSFPTVVAFAPDGRIFVAEQEGTLRIIKNGNLLSKPFIKLNVNSAGERGLIGVAFDPDFENNKYIYLYHTVPDAPIHNRITRFTANGDTVLNDSGQIILDLDPLSNATNHNGGSIKFGNDGKLYVAVGENANSSNSQNLDTYLGKLLRINPDGSAPTDNPFTTGTEQKKRIWAYGLRNPFTIDIDKNTGRVFVNDVGSDGVKKREEVNNASEKGLNFGWPLVEGYTSNTSYASPLYAYLPTMGTDSSGCAITGGTFFNPLSTNFPDLYKGKYFFMDYCEKWINVVDLTSGSKRTTFATDIPGSGTSLTTGSDGNLYYLSRAAGAIYKITYSSITSNSTINSSMEANSVNMVNVFPIPVQETLQIKMYSQQDEEAQFYLYNNLSKEVLSKQEHLSVGENQITLSFDNINSGIYYLKINYNGKTSINKIIK